MQYVLLILYIVALSCFALPCPKGGGIIYKGDNTAEILKRCGEPTIRYTQTQKISSTHQFVYYQPHLYDQGSARIVLLFTDNQLSAIRVYERYPYFTCRQAAIQVGVVTTVQTSCGNWDYPVANIKLCGVNFGIGTSLPVVEQLCAPREQELLNQQTIQRTELIYGREKHETLILENDKLIDWQ